MSRRKTASVLCLVSSIFYALLALLARQFVKTDQARASIEDNGVPIRIVAAMALLGFVIGLFDVVQRVETAGADTRRPVSRLGSSAILLGGGLATTILAIAPLTAYVNAVDEIGAHAIAFASVPLAAVCLGATRGFASASIAPAPWVLLGYVTTLALAIQGTAGVLRQTHTESARLVTGDPGFIVSQRPVLDPLGTTSAMLFAIFGVWLIVTAMVCYRAETSARAAAMRTSLAATLRRAGRPRPR